MFTKETGSAMERTVLRQALRLYLRVSGGEQHTTAVRMLRELGAGVGCLDGGCDATSSWQQPLRGGRRAGRTEQVRGTVSDAGADTYDHLEQPKPTPAADMEPYSPDFEDIR